MASSKLNYQDMFKAAEANHGVYQASKIRLGSSLIRSRAQW